MGRVWSITLATACMALALANGCGDGERRDPGAAASAGSGGRTLTGEGGGHRGGSGGAAGDGDTAGDGTVASGGANDGNGGAPEGGSSSRPRGGSGGTRAGGTGGTGAGTSGGTGGSATNGGSVGSGADAGDTGLAGASTGGTAGLTQLDVCSRQTTLPSALAWDVSQSFEHAVNFDCRITWVHLLYIDPDTGLDKRVAFLNQLIDFGLGLWGCFGGVPPQSFDLIFKPTPLSAADVALLIDDYVGAASDPLNLDPGEIDDMRTILNRLAEPLLMDPDPGDFSSPDCASTGAAGAAGAGGQAGSG